MPLPVLSLVVSGILLVVLTALWFREGRARRGSPATRVSITSRKSAPERLATIAAPSSDILQARNLVRYSALESSLALGSQYMRQRPVSLMGATRR